MSPTTTPLDQQWNSISNYLQVEDAFWRTLSIELRKLPQDDPQVKAFQQQARTALHICEQARIWLNDDNEVTSTQVAMAGYWAGFLSSPRDLGNLDVRTLMSDAGQYRQNVVHWQNWDTVMGGLRDATIGFYQLFIGLTPAGQVWTIITGTDIMGREVGMSGRVVAALELASQAAITTAAVAYHIDGLVPATTGRARVAARNLAENPFRGVTEGTAVRPEDFGMLPQAARQVNAIAEEEEVFIWVRPTNEGALASRALGNPGKPALIKPKTINDLDIMLGADPAAENRSWVGFFEPKMPARTPEITDEQWAALTKRFNERSVEYADCKVKIEHLAEDGQIQVRNGVIIDTGVAGNTGQPITGDYDLWRITDRNGQPLPPEKLQQVLEKLRQGPFGAQHGAHTDWVIDPSKMTPEDYATAVRVDQGVRAKHGPGQDSLIVFRGETRPVVAGYEHPGDGPHLANPVVPDGQGGVPPATGAAPAAGPPRVTRTRVLVGAAAAGVAAAVAIPLAVSGGGKANVPETPAAERSATTTPGTTQSPAAPGTTQSPAAPATSIASDAPSAPTAAAGAPPALTPIQAIFNQDAYSTYYSENATSGSGQSLTYTWDIRMDSDRGCASGFKGSNPMPSQAAWFHADVDSQPPEPKGPCNHQFYGVRGHPGHVTVTVKSAGWVCTATYFGSLSGTGDPPPACTRG